MELPLTVQLSKQEIAKLYRSSRIGEDFQNRLDRIVMSIYDDGVQMGLTESLNYVENEQDRQRIFKALDNWKEQ